MTYTHGLLFISKTKRQITKHDIYLLCLKLQEKLGAGYKIMPEAITEGGIEFVDYPNKKKDEYKSMRMRSSCNGVGRRGWTQIPMDFKLEDWKNNNDSLYTLFEGEKKLQISTFLKAFHGAPVWTKEELLHIADIFQEFGFTYIKSSMPKKKWLDKRIN